MSLKNVLLGWLLIAAMVLYATALTIVHAGHTVIDFIGSLGGGDIPSISSH